MARRAGRGWYDLAGAMLALGGLLHGVHGFAAIFRKEYFSGAPAIYDNLQFWGWVWLVLAFVQLGTAVALFDGRARVMGIVLAALSAIMAFAALDAAPTQNVVLIAIDVLVIVGLTLHPEPDGRAGLEPSARQERELPMQPR